MKRISQLDGIRGIAILLVIIWHYIPCQYADRTSPFGWLCRCLSLTWCGVDLFFVLSGFLIAGILLDEQKSSHYFKVFYIRRICRIFPLYFSILILFIIAQQFAFSQKQEFYWLFKDPFPYWSYATFTQNFWMAAKDTFGPHWLGMTWSLAVEEHFYLFLPLMIYFLPRTTVFPILIGMILMAPLLRASTSSFFWGFVATPWRADSLLFGSCLAMFVRSKSLMEIVLSYKRALIGLWIIMLFGATVLTFYPARFGSFDHLWLSGLFSLFILLAITETIPLLNGFLTNPIMVQIGTLSYGMYMFHELIVGSLHAFFFGKAPRIESAADLYMNVLAFIVTIVLAAFSYYFFELPILKYGRKFRY